MADANFSTTIRYVSGSSIALPSLTLIAPGGEVIWREHYQVSVSDIESHLPSLD